MNPTENEKRERGAALQILLAAQAPRYQNQRDIAAVQPMSYIYLSPLRPLWTGFHNAVEDDAGFVGYLGDESRLVETLLPASIDFLERFELLPASPEAMRAVACKVVASRTSIALIDAMERRMALARLHGGSFAVAEYEVSEPGNSNHIGTHNTDSLDLALVWMAQQGGYSREVPERYIGSYLGSLSNDPGLNDSDTNGPR